jgi:1,4-alpha-glucan branching enzyme
MSTYEMHLASWRRGKTWTELADELPAYLADLGFTHVELMPVMQHPFGGSWGYHVTSYFAPDSRFGDPDGFRHLVDRLHQAGIGVILDWVPGHFATDPWALVRFDGTPLYEDPNPQRGWHKEWGSHIFNFGRHEVRNFLYANALYWLEEFHADGLRVDGVASMLYLDYSREEGEWTPNKYGGRENLEAVQFLQEMNATVYKRTPGVVTIAEESTSWPGVTRPTSDGGLGFGFKWNMGWMHDSLAYIQHEPVHRAYHHGEMTFSLVYAWSENFVLPISHDEVVHGKGSLLRKMPGDRWQQLANLRAFLGYMWAHPGKQLLFMGAELGQESEWAEARELDWWLLDHPEHRGVQALVRDLNTAYTSSPAIWSLDSSPAGFQWIDANDAGRNTFSFIRRGGEAPDVVCVSNFSAVPHDGYRLGFPAAGVWDEVLNTDAEAYTGSGVGNLGSVTAVEGEHVGQPAYADVVIPPLATVWFRARD